jgi:membrane protease YdiL (CAAX protease family)
VPLIVLSLVFNMPAEPNDHMAKFDGARRCATAGTCHDKVLVICSSAGPDSRAAGADNSGGETKKPHLMADIVTSIGAGIYEELVFRLILICLLMILFQDVMQLERGSSIVLSILVSAALFSAYHHVDFLSGRLNPTDPFSLTKFAFRAIAGVYFAVVFAIRGFGITAGAHAFYDIIATVLNAAFYEP